MIYAYFERDGKQVTPSFEDKIEYFIRKNAFDEFDVDSNGNPLSNPKFEYQLVERSMGLNFHGKVGECFYHVHVECGEVRDDVSDIELENLLNQARVELSLKYVAYQEDITEGQGCEEIGGMFVLRLPLTDKLKLAVITPRYGDVGEVEIFTVVDMVRNDRYCTVAYVEA